MAGIHKKIGEIAGKGNMWFWHLKLDLLQKKDKKVLQQWNECIEFFHNRDEKLIIHKSLDGHTTLKSEGSTALTKMKNKARPNECIRDADISWFEYQDTV